MSLNGFARGVGGLQDEDEFRLFIIGIAPEMGEHGFEDKNVPCLHQIYLAVDHIFDFSLQAIDEFMSRMYNLSFAATAVF